MHCTFALTATPPPQRFSLSAHTGDDKRTLADVAVLQAADGSWFHPGPTATPAVASTAPAAGFSPHVHPPARAFHAAAALGRSVWLFGGHMYSKERRVLQRHNDLHVLDTVSSVWGRKRGGAGGVEMEIVVRCSWSWGWGKVMVLVCASWNVFVRGRVQG